MRRERQIHNEAGMVLSALLKRYDHLRYVPEQDEVLPVCRRLVDAHVRRRIESLKAEGRTTDEDHHSRKTLRIKEALVAITMVSFKHQLAFLEDWKVDLVEGAKPQ